MFTTTKFSPGYKKTILPEYSTLKEALEAISSSGLLIACIVSKNSGIFLGILTDSDIRKALLSGAALDSSIENWVNKKPVTAPENFSSEELTLLSHNVGKREIPLLNNSGEIVDIFLLGLYDVRLSEGSFQDPKIAAKKLDGTISNYMFILAGGLGSRLRSVVNDRPKPLALIGGRPIIDTLMNNAYSQGFKNFYISTNYLAEQIETHFQHDKYSFFNIEFVKENKRLGTAGSIGLINHKIEKSILVCNADILTSVQYNKILESHEKNSADVTCVVRPFQLNVPYGVIEISDHKITAITEKPKYDFLVNAGIYVLSPDICKLIKKEEYLDMPDFIKYCMSIGKTIHPFLLHEYWIDVGRPEDYQRANNDFHLYFEG